MDVTKTVVLIGWVTVLVVFVTILSFMAYYQATFPVIERKAFVLTTPTNFSYKIFIKRKSWKHAQLSCYAVESRLAEVYKAEQQRKLRKFIRKYGTPEDELSGYWIGGIKRNSTWTWASSGRYIYETYTSGWHNSLLPNGQTKDCMEMQLIKSTIGESLSWNNIDCEAKRLYICQGPHFKLNQPT